MSQYNDRWSPDFRIKDLMWTPLFAPTRYVYLPEWRSDGFKYSFSAEKQNKYRRLTTSPLVNDEVNLLAEELLNKSTIGKDQTPDLLALTYYAGNYNHRSVQECAMEMQDTYVRLDEQLDRLIAMVEKKVGRQRVLFVLTSTGYSDAGQADGDLSRYRIPSGEFNITRAKLLLNMYLSAVYGQAQYVEASMGNQLYFDLKGIEKKNINLSELLERSADFLIQLSGVRDVYTSQRLAQGAWTPGIRNLRNAYNPRCSGDVLIQVAPGWTLVDEQTGERKQYRESYMTFPLYFYGLDIAPQEQKEPVSVDRVAPTLARCMRIRAPNACNAAPLRGVR